MASQKLENPVDRKIILYEILWERLKSWIETDGWKGYPYTSNADLLDEAARKFSWTFSSESLEIMLWMKKHGFIKIIQPNIQYAQIFPAKTDGRDELFSIDFLGRKDESKGT
ncbi:MAG: hypothetical protein M1285_05515 [Candidatus Thermoplasmatota archaeon]|nr:hypothetical protein [Candidatus Thermoplasmatota archaeon]